MGRIGIFSGTFDPVHKGHLAFALKAVEVAGLDKVYFLPESVPRRKEGVTHYAHRIAMLRLAIKPHRNLAVLDLPDKQFTVKQTLPRLKRRFQEDELYMLIGSDVLPFISAGTWPGMDNLLKSMKLVIGMRTGADAGSTTADLQVLAPGLAFHIIMTGVPHVSSRDIRSAFSRGSSHVSALSMLDGYIRQNWLYQTVPD